MTSFGGWSVISAPATSVARTSVGVAAVEHSDWVRLLLGRGLAPARAVGGPQGGSVEYLVRGSGPVGVPGDASRRRQAAAAAAADFETLARLIEFHEGQLRRLASGRDPLRTDPEVLISTYSVLECVWVSDDPADWVVTDEGLSIVRWGLTGPGRRPLLAWTRAELDAQRVTVMRGLDAGVDAAARKAAAVAVGDVSAALEAIHRSAIASFSTKLRAGIETLQRERKELESAKVRLERECNAIRAGAAKPDTGTPVPMRSPAVPPSGRFAVVVAALDSKWGRVAPYVVMALLTVLLVWGRIEGKSKAESLRAAHAGNESARQALDAKEAEIQSLRQRVDEVQKSRAARESDIDLLEQRLGRAKGETDQLAQAARDCEEIRKALDRDLKAAKAEVDRQARAGTQSGKGAAAPPPSGTNPPVQATAPAVAGNKPQPSGDAKQPHAQKTVQANEPSKPASPKQDAGPSVVSGGSSGPGSPAVGPQSRAVASQASTFAGALCECAASIDPSKAGWSESLLACIGGKAGDASDGVRALRSELDAIGSARRVSAPADGQDWVATLRASVQRPVWDCWFLAVDRDGASPLWFLWHNTANSPELSERPPGTDPRLVKSFDRNGEPQYLEKRLGKATVCRPGWLAPLTRFENNAPASEDATSSVRRAVELLDELRSQAKVSRTKNRDDPPLWPDLLIVLSGPVLDSLANARGSQEIDRIAMEAGQLRAAWAESERQNQLWLPAAGPNPSTAQITPNRDWPAEAPLRVERLLPSARLKAWKQMLQHPGTPSSQVAAPAALPVGLLVQGDSGDVRLCPFLGVRPVAVDAQILEGAVRRDVGSFDESGTFRSLGGQPSPGFRVPSLVYVKDRAAGPPAPAPPALNQPDKQP